MTAADTDVRSPGELWAEVKRLRGEGDAAGAVSVLEELCAAAPSDPRFLICMGELQVQLGRLNEARLWLGRARDANPKDPGQLELLARLELKRRLQALA